MTNRQLLNIYSLILRPEQKLTEYDNIIVKDTAIQSMKKKSTQKTFNFIGKRTVF